MDGITMVAAWLAIGFVAGYVLALMFFSADSHAYDYDDIERAYTEGFEAGRKAGGWTEDREDDEA